AAGQLGSQHCEGGVMNATGSYRSTRKNHFAAYEKLPPMVRKALQDAAFDYAAQPFLKLWRDGMSVSALVKMIKTMDCQKTGAWKRLAQRLARSGTSIDPSM